MKSHEGEHKYSDEFINLVSRIVPGKSEGYYNQLYKDMLDFIEKDINGEGRKLRYSDFYRTVWHAQTVEK